MSVRLRALERYVPGWAARSALRRLFAATASAFGSDPGDVRALGRSALIRRYASFTAEAAERALTDGSNLDALSRRMWTSARALGESFRRRLRVRTRDDALRAARVAYGMIGIDLVADARGDVIIERCAFATTYSPQVCRLMSNLDAGLIVGLTGGGRLAFSERITEGAPRCLARVSWAGA